MSISASAFRLGFTGIARYVGLPTLLVTVPGMPGTTIAGTAEPPIDRATLTTRNQPQLAGVCGGASRRHWDGGCADRSAAGTAPSTR